jgi:hypothetical protein
MMMVGSRSSTYAVTSLNEPECPALLDSYPLALREARPDNDDEKLEIAPIQSPV